MYVSLAHRHNWTPSQISDMPSEFIDELMAFHQAEAEHAKEQKPSG